MEIPGVETAIAESTRIEYLLDLTVRAGCSLLRVSPRNDGECSRPLSCAIGSQTRYRASHAKTNGAHDTGSLDHLRLPLAECRKSAPYGS